jgi:aldehyde:ferredoxin oxidoreductase
MDGCRACPIQCKKVVKSEKKYRADPEYGGPEYETIEAVGTSCGVVDMVNPHGADHCFNLHDPLVSTEGRLVDQFRELMGEIDQAPQYDYGALKTAMLRYTFFDRLIKDSLISCQFVPYSIPQLVELTNAVTGWNMTVNKMFTVAERALTMYRLFNIREGLNDNDDKPPGRFYEGKSGALEDKPCDLEAIEEARNYYYAFMDWDTKTGVPLKEKVEELQID